MSIKKRVVATPCEFWFRAWYVADTGELQLTRTGHATKREVVEDAEQQFGLSWKTLSTVGTKRPGQVALIRAVRGAITLSPKDTKFQDTHTHASQSAQKAE